MRPGSVGVDDVAELCPERRLGKRLGQQLDAGIEPPLMDDGIARIPGREQDFDRRIALARLLGQLPSIHSARQTDIRENDDDLWMGIQNLQAARACGASSTL